MGTMPQSRSARQPCRRQRSSPPPKRFIAPSVKSMELFLKETLCSELLRCCQGRRLSGLQPSEGSFYRCFLFRLGHLRLPLTFTPARRAQLKAEPGQHILPARASTSHLHHSAWLAVPSHSGPIQTGNPSASRSDVRNDRFHQQCCDRSSTHRDLAAGRRWRSPAFKDVADGSRCASRPLADVTFHAKVVSVTP